MLSPIHALAAPCPLPRRWPRHPEPQIIYNTVKASRCPWSKPQPNQESLNGLRGDLLKAVESYTCVNLSRLISTSEGRSSFRWQIIRVWRQKEMKGTPPPPPPPPTRGFLQRRRNSEIFHLCCWDHGATIAETGSRRGSSRLET